MLNPQKIWQAIFQSPSTFIISEILKKVLFNYQKMFDLSLFLFTVKTGFVY